MIIFGSSNTLILYFESKYSAKPLPSTSSFPAEALSQSLVGLHVETGNITLNVAFLLSLT